MSLNKNVVSNLENGQIQGGTGLSVFICPIPTRFNCPILTPACPIITRFDCPILTVGDCPILTVGNCPSLVDGCPTDFVC